MIWLFKRTSKRMLEEQADVQARIEQTDAHLARVERRWPTVQSMSEALVTRRLENGFGEELTVSYQPRMREKSANG